MESTARILQALNTNNDLDEGNVAWTENHLKLLISLSLGKLDYINLMEELMKMKHGSGKLPVNMATVRELLGLATGNLEFVKSLADYEINRVNYSKDKVNEVTEGDQTKNSAFMK